MELLTLSPATLFRCMQAARTNQMGLARILGISDRTLSRRLSGGGAVVLPHHLQALAGAVFPNDSGLAAELAGMGGTTLEALGLGQPAPPPPVAAPPAPVAASPRPGSAPLPVTTALLDSIVCAAADLHDLPSRQVRPMVAAAFARAHELGFTLEAVTRGFAASPPPVVPKPSKEG
jgi:hypothetical protein